MRLRCRQCGSKPRAGLPTFRCPLQTTSQPFHGAIVSDISLTLFLCLTCSTQTMRPILFLHFHDRLRGEGSEQQQTAREPHRFRACCEANATFVLANHPELGNKQGRQPAPRVLCSVLGRASECVVNSAARPAARPSRQRPQWLHSP